ncbi:hypothetical protein VTH06DRAFT_4304 [Thermothelomyces fergusii]
MAVVLTSDDDSYFSPNLRRSHSQPKLGIKRSGFHTSASTSRLSDLFSQPPQESIISSRPSSPQPTHTESVYLSDSSTPATNFSLASDTDEPSATPQCKHEDYFSRSGNQEAPSSTRAAEWNGDSEDEQIESAATSRPGSPELPERAEDDIAIRPLPSHHVDYLSHNWREEDIWSSWKLVVSRRSDYSNAARLENASWRTWMKAKNNLGTVSAETLNWLKDYDVTWLYGPLQTGSSSWNNTSNDSTSSRLSKSNSFTNKKPILKKRSMSELMLQRSLSTSSLVKQAAAAVQAQQKGGLKRLGRRPGLERANTDYITFPFSSRGISHDGTSLFPSARSSGIVSPNSGKKHIHFNEQVSQCIAVEVKGDDDDDDDIDTDNHRYGSDSDDEAITMKVTLAKKRRSVLKKLKGNNKGGENRTIAMLPSTTLKYREDTPEPAEMATKHSSNGVLRSPVLSPSSSQETLRPVKKSGKIFFAGDEEDEEDDEDSVVERINIAPGAPSSLQSNHGGSGLRRSVSTTSLAGGSHGLRRTTSGMFMPPETSSPTSSPDDGVLGRIINTEEAAFNTNRLRRNSRSFQELYD